MRRKLLIALAMPAAVLTLAVAGGATTASLPGGTAITVSIGSPADNSTLPNAPFTVTGSASVGVGVAVPDTTLVYIVDISGSTSSSDGTPGRCPRQNVYDSLADTTLDCELLAVRKLNQAAILTGTVAKIGMIGFAGTQTDTFSPLNITSAAVLDLTPGGVVGTLTAPDANTFTPAPGMTTVFAPQNNLDWVVQSAYLGAQTPPPLVGWPVRGPADGFTQFSTKDVGTGTNYYAALAALKTLTASITTSRTVVAFLSDGFANLTVDGHALAEALNALNPSTMKIYTFAVGASAGCGSPAPSTDGSLAQISARFGTTCQLLTDPADAANVVPSVIASQLTGLTLTVDGVAQSGVTISPALPRTGPSTVSFSKTLTLLPGGPYAICATASGKDGAGTGSAGPDCIHVTIKAPPTITFSGGVGPVPEGTAAPVTATVNGATTTQWTSSGGTGHCTFDNPAAVSTSVTCDDDGPYTLTLTASDGVNPAPVSASETLEVTNVAPVPTLTLSPGMIPLHGTVLAHTTIVDPGTNDTQTCSNDWGDGSLATLGCADSHVYDTAGTYTVTTTATDDDGGQGISTARVVVNGPPTVTVSDVSGAEGSAIPLSATATDAEHDTLSYHWRATAGPGVDPGASCSFSNDGVLTPTITCTDEGTWAIELTVSDNVNIDVVKTGTLTVSDVAPTATLAVTPGMIPLGGSVAAHTTITDPGTTDAKSCTINWGDGTPETTGCDGGHTYNVAGLQTVTVTVTDDDGSTTATARVLVNAPPAVSVANTAGNEGSAIALSATATDPNGDPLTYAWTAAPAGPVDAGAACSFGNPASLATTITCTDDGLWTVTLTVSDGVNQPVSASGIVNVANVAPTLVVSNPASGASARNVVFNGIVTDAGSNDTQSCVINWGDGVTDTIPAIGGFCNATHSYDASVAAATIHVTASDDDGGVSPERIIALTFNRAPVCTAVRASDTTLWPPNHQLVLINLIGATDPDAGDSVSYAVTGVRQDEPLLGGGSGNFSPDAQLAAGGGLYLRSERDGTGDGRVYTIAFRVSDSHGASCTGTTTVTVVHDQAHAALLTPGVSVNSFG